METGAVAEQSWLLGHRLVNEHCVSPPKCTAVRWRSLGRWGRRCFLWMSLLFLENLCDVLFKSAVPEEQLNTC